MRALLALAKQDQERIHAWIKELDAALEEGGIKESDNGDSAAARLPGMADELTPYGGPYFGVDLGETVHLVCAFHDHKCAILALNAAGKFDF